MSLPKHFDEKYTPRRMVIRNLGCAVGKICAFLFGGEKTGGGGSLWDVVDGDGNPVSPQDFYDEIMDCLFATCQLCAPTVVDQGFVLIPFGDCDPAEVEAAIDEGRYSHNLTLEDPTADEISITDIEFAAGSGVRVNLRGDESVDAGHTVCVTIRIPKA